MLYLINPHRRKGRGMARKRRKRRTAAQMRATRKMIAARRKSLRKKGAKRRRRRNPGLSPKPAGPSNSGPSSATRNQGRRKRRKVRHVLRRGKVEHVVNPKRRRKAVAKRKRARRGSTRRPVRRRRRRRSSGGSYTTYRPKRVSVQNPRFTIRNMGRILQQGAMDAAAVVGGKAVTRMIANFIPLPTEGMFMVFAKQAVSAIGAGMVAQQFLTARTASFVLAGGLAAPVESLLAQVPVIGDFLGDDFLELGEAAGLPIGEAAGLPIGEYPEVEVGEYPEY